MTMPKVPLKCPLCEFLCEFWGPQKHAPDGESKRRAFEDALAAWRKSLMEATHGSPS